MCGRTFTILCVHHFHQLCIWFLYFILSNKKKGTIELFDVPDLYLELPLFLKILLLFGMTRNHFSVTRSIVFVNFWNLYEYRSLWNIHNGGITIRPATINRKYASDMREALELIIEKSYYRHAITAYSIDIACTCVPITRIIQRSDICILHFCYFLCGI